LWTTRKFRQFCGTATKLTINVYIKSVTESHGNAMDALSAKFEKEPSNAQPEACELRKRKGL